MHPGMPISNAYLRQPDHSEQQPFDTSTSTAPGSYMQYGYYSSPPPVDGNPTHINGSASNK